MSILDLIVIALLWYATFTGCCILWRHGAYFKAFRNKDFVARRLDAFAYLAVILSTVLCFTDSIARLFWVLDIGWTNAGNSWQLIWLAMHTGFAILSISVHWFIGRLLSLSTVRRILRETHV